jgi:hypothetical protein
MEKTVHQPSGHGQRARRVLVIATDEITDGDLIEALRQRLGGRDGSELLVVAPAVERTPFRHALGDVDSAIREAKQRLEKSVAELRRAGLPALGEVGDSDPVIAADDALRRFDADEVLIVAHSDDQARWFEDGLFDRACQELRPAVRMLPVRDEGGRLVAHPEEASASGPGLREPAGSAHEVELSPNLPEFDRGDLLGILIAVVGTILAIVLAATGPGADSAGGAAQILIAMAVALINMAHVVGLVLFESVRHRGGWQRFFRNLSMVATPGAIVVNGLISLLS